MAKPAPVTIATEPIGSIPRPVDLIERIAKGDSEDRRLDPLYEDAIRKTIEQLKPQALRWLPTANRGSITISTYWVHGLPNTAPDGFIIPFKDGHTPVVAHRWPFPLQPDCYLDVGMRFTHVPVKQAVISPSALRLITQPKGSRLVFD